MSDRGFIHDVNIWQDDYDEDNRDLHTWHISVYRCEEEDGHVVSCTGPLLAEASLNLVESADTYDVPEPDFWAILETDPALPKWAMEWAYDRVEESLETEDYKRHAALWLTEEEVDK